MNKTKHPQLPILRRTWGATWPGANIPGAWWLDLFYIVLVCLLIVGAYLAVAANDAYAASTQTIQMQQSKIAKLEAVVVECLNGGNLAGDEGTVIACRKAETLK